MKTDVIRALIAHFEQELSVNEQSANAAREAATHEETKAEDQHDTRAIEASYLAAGQSARIAEIRKTIHEFKGYLDLAHQPITEARPGALLTLENEESPGKPIRTFFALHGGGTTITLGTERFSVTTPLSPLGQSLAGLKSGDEASVETKAGTQLYLVRKID